MQSYLDTGRLAALVRNKRSSKVLRDISKEIGNVSTSTLSRIENGSMPDMETFIALCNWLEIHPGDLFVAKPDRQNLETDTSEEIVLLLLGDRRLAPETAYALAQIVKATYRYLLE